MERLGKSFILVIEPLDFNIYQKKVFFNTFGCVIGTESEFFRNLMYKMCEKRVEIWQAHYTPKIITEIRKNLRLVLRKKIRNEEDAFRILSAFADLSFYTAVSHNKDAYLKSFSTIQDGKILRYCYVGSEIYNTSEILEKIEEKIQYSREEKGDNKGSCFEFHQILN